MSEIKRVAFTTISSSSGNSSNIGSAVPGAGAGALSSMVGSGSAGNGAITAMATSSAALHRFGVPDPVTSQKSSTGSTSSSKPTKTIRLNMELFASNSNSFPEFNYSKLIHLEKKKLKKLKSKQNGFSDPFEENDDDVARIAKELEKKYGTTYASGRGRSKKDDLCDIGLGYDENDSFIDNTEAYDEIIPEEVEATYGGFYINSGALEFKQLSCTEKTDEIIKMPNKTRKRALSSSSEESESSDDEKGGGGDGGKETDGPKTTSSTVSAVTNAQQNTIPKPSTSSSKQKTALPTEKRHKTSSDKESSDKEKSAKSKSSAPTSTAPSSAASLASASPKDDDNISESSSKDKTRVDRSTVKTTTVKDMLKAKRDNFLKMQEEELKTKTSNGEAKASNSTEDVSESDSSSDESDLNQEPSAKKLKKTSEEDSDKLRHSDTVLPDLSDAILRDVQDIKDTAKTSNRTGKKFQFDEKLTEIFLRVDDCLCLDKNVRNSVFAHLEYQLLLPKYFLLRKAKQLRINQEKTKTKKAFVKLRKAVSEIMLVIGQQYQTNLSKYEEFQSLNPGIDVHKLENAPKMPKKRFQWNDNVRTHLYDLYQVRWMSFTVLRTRKESFEDFVHSFLKDKVMNIWPNGWVKLEEIKREIEKKKNAPKKLKENKKPEESQTALSSNSKSHLLSQDAAAMSSGSKLSINTADNHAMASSSEHITANLKPNDLTTTKLLPAHSNASTEHLHSSKAYSSSSGKVHRSSTNSPLNLCSSQSQIVPKIEKSSSGSIINNNNSANPNQNLNSNRSSSSGNVNTISKNVIDLVSPSKRTDHSINSIMSSPSSTSSSVSTTPQPQHSAGSMGNTLMVDNNTHVINIDNFKSATEIINTSNQLINHKTHSHSNERSKGRSSAMDVHPHTHHPSLSSMKSDYIHRDSSSESDGVEIVGVYQNRSSVASLPIVNKNKYKKSSHHGSRSDSPGLHDKLKTAAAAPKKPLECTDLDVNKIMKALKELEELQQTGNYVPDLSSFTNSNHNANTSPLAYGKDLTQ